MSKKPEHKHTWQKLKENPKLFKRYFIKEYIIKAIRAYFEDKKYHELECPILTDSLPSERYVEVLDTDVNFGRNIKKKLFLIPSTETFNKRILSAGLGNHFVISKVFRDLGDSGPNHSPEFSMLEWYTLGSDYLKIGREAEELIKYIKKFLEEKLDFYSGDFVSYQGTKIHLKSPWKMYSIRELLKKYLKTDLENIIDLKNFKKFAQKRGYNVGNVNDWQIIFEEIFANEIEEKMPDDSPYFLYDYPSIMCPLTKQKKSDPLLSEKIELYIAKKEISNGYTELRDWKIQETNLKSEEKARSSMRRKRIPFDRELIQALKLGIPEVAGMGLGIDRLAMIFADAKNISDINYFPCIKFDILGAKFNFAPR